MHALVHALVPAGVDDPAHPSGGNTYDRRVIGELARQGWTVCERAVAGRWPRPTDDDRAGLGRLLAGLPDGAVVLLDGLVASAAAAPLVAESARLRLVVLVHLPLGVDWALAADDERAVLRRARAVITTSRWTRDWLVRRYRLAPGRIAVAEPGVDQAAAAAGSAGGTRLLCVGVLAAHKGQDVLVEALRRLSDLDWSAVIAGAPDVDPAFAGRVRSASDRLDGRIRLAGALDAQALAGAYRSADLLVLPSRAETFGMVVQEALARAVPVVASDVGGVRDALGRDPAAGRPGLLVEAGDADALSAALRGWLTDADLRVRLRAAAAGRRGALSGWPATAGVVSETLLEVSR